MIISIFRKYSAALSLFFILYSFFFLLPSSASAAGEFTADYDVNYAISPNGTTIVTQNVTLTNKLTNLYAQQYSIVIDSVNIKNIIAHDSRGMISPQITQKDGKTQIVLVFNDKIVGLGKTLPFTLRFENGDIAQKNGSIWEINIPGISVDTDIETYFVSLSVPPSFGPNAYMSPLPKNQNRWTKEQMINGGISAAYGDQQVFDLTLTYNLQNPVLAPRLMEIALPPNTAFQNIYIDHLEPKPKTVLRDADGNWLAQYELLPSQHLEIKAHIFAFISLTPWKDYKDIMDQKEQYVKPQKYWETTDPQIVALAKQYTTPRSIYDYVVSTLTYDYSRVNQNPVRKGALSTLQSPTHSICMEFTDLFIAIARQAGIPARESIGYAYTSNAKLRPLSFVSDVLHSWPEYFDTNKNIWIPIDPTWADTTGGVNYFDKLDFNHIVFAIHGISSDYPYPAGFYKKIGKSEKDVEVTFAKTIPKLPVNSLTTTFEFPKSVTSGFSTKGRLIIENPNGIPLPSAQISIASSPFDVAIERREINIPPYAKLSIPLRMELPNYFTQGEGSIRAMVNGQTTVHSFMIHPLANRFVIPGAIVLWVFIISLWLLIKLHRKKQKKK